MVILALSLMLSGCAVTEVAVNLAKTVKKVQIDEKDTRNTKLEANEIELNPTSPPKNDDIITKTNLVTKTIEKKDDKKVIKYLDDNPYRGVNSGNVKWNAKK